MLFPPPQNPLPTIPYQACLKGCSGLSTQRLLTEVISSQENAFAWAMVNAHSAPWYGLAGKGR